MSTPTVAYLASGKLFLKRDGRTVEAVESLFGQEVVEDAIRRREKNEWKTKSSTGRLLAGGAPWDGGDANADTRQVRITGVTRGRNSNELVYALETDRVGGLFVYEVATGTERRIYHGSRFKARHLNRHSAQPLVAFSQQQEDGTSGISVMNLDTNDLHHVTEGDSLDEAPAWIQGSGVELVFQSAGVARNEQGVLVGVGPYALQQLDADAGRMSTVREDEKQDLLLPRPLRGGGLCYIRRPYQAYLRPSLLRILADVVLLPVRLVWAFLGFLNFFSLMFSGKPLLTAGGPKREGPDPRHLMLWGKIIDAEKAERQAKKGDVAGLVPRDWELVRSAVDGTDQVLAEGVIAYDICSDGSVIFTNGSGVYQLDEDGRRQLLCQGKLIEWVAVLE